MMRGIWDRETVAVLLLAALLPVGVTWLLAGGTDALLRLVFFLVVAGAWHVVWMLARAQPPSLAGIVTALALAMLAPQDLGLVALLLSTSFGVVIAELAFGGWGRNVLNPATVTLAFMGFGYPAAPWPDLPVQLWWAAIPAALLGAILGVMSARLLLGAALTLIAASLLGADLSDALPAITITLVLLVADPVASASTALGRWLNGVLYGAFITLSVENWHDAAPVQLCVSAALLTSLAAPLLDEAALLLWLQRRKRRHG